MPTNSTRSAQGTGNIRKRTVNRKGNEYTYWEARYTVGVDPGTGKQIQKSISGKTQKEVTQKLKAILHEIDTGTYTIPNKMTVGEWLDIWLNEYAALTVKPLSLTAYRSRTETHIKPAFGKTPLQSLSPIQVQTFLNDCTRKKNLAPKTVKNIHGILHKALKQAVKLNYINVNPADNCELPRMTQKEIVPLTEEEISAFLGKIENGEQLKNLFILALFAGMREGELCGLSWDAVDFDNNIVTVKQQLQRTNGKGALQNHFISTTKNDRMRTITVAPFVMQALRDEKRKQAAAKLQAGELWSNPWNLVFTQEDGRYISMQVVYNHFKKIAAAIGCPDARVHDMRHTYAVTSLQEGDDIKTVQSNLGHATASFTLDVYGHVSEKMKQDSANRMEKFIEKVRA